MIVPVWNVVILVGGWVIVSFLAGVFYGALLGARSIRRAYENGLKEIETLKRDYRRAIDEVLKR